MKNIEEFVSSNAGRLVIARLTAAVPGIALLLALSSAPMAQTIQTIDFESFPDGSTPAALDEVSTQFADETGMSFLLESGAAPVLAKVGGGREAFASVFGVDTVSGDVGQFF